MLRELRWTALVIAIAATPLAAQQTPAESPAAASSPGDRVVATFDGGTITASELDAEAHSSLVPLLQQIYDIKQSTLRDMVYRRMLATEAKSQGITAEELYKREVTDKVQAPSDAEVSAMVARYRGQLAKDDDQARKQVEDVLRQRQLKSVEEQFKDRLVAESGLKIKLEPPRVDVPIDADDPSTGPADAPVTMIEFADYQCPFCTRAQETVKKVREVYGDKVRLVVKQLPLPMHQQARQAAEAALCAQAQGKFWEMHDWLFAHHDQLAVDKLKAGAAGLGLDAEKFDTCMDSHQEAARIDADLAQAAAVGANATPTFFVNGRLVRGAQPFDAVAAIINDELARKGIPVPTGGGAEPEPTPSEG